MSSSSTCDSPRGLLTVSLVMSSARQYTAYWVPAPSAPVRAIRTTLSPVTARVAVTMLPAPGLAIWVPSTERRLDPSAGPMVSVMVSLLLQPTE